MPLQAWSAKPTIHFAIHPLGKVGVGKGPIIANYATQGNNPRVRFALRTFSTPIAIAAVRLET